MGFKDEDVWHILDNIIRLGQFLLRLLDNVLEMLLWQQNRIVSEDQI